MEADLVHRQREVADAHIHGTAGVRPAERFGLEREHPRPVAGITPVLQVRENRRMSVDAAANVEARRPK